MRPAKFNTQERHSIARAYFAGAKPSELAAEKRVSPAYIIATANWFEKKIQERAERSAAHRMRQEQCDLETWFREQEIAASEFGDVDAKAAITLPYVSIQHR